MPNIATSPAQRLALVVLLALLCTALPALAQAQAAAGNSGQTTPIMTVDQIRPGMHGYALTVFRGTQPERMDLEVLGVLRNMAGPRSDVILIKLLGEKPEYTGVVAGMSGSPVYIDGKLIGALAYRIGEFPKEPIAGVTPIESMLRISEFDHSPAPEPDRASSAAVPAPVAGPGASASASDYTNYLKPIETPLVFNGFSEETLRRFSAQFASAGLSPVMGAGSSSNDSQPEPIEPGSSVGIQLVRGDLDISATCTVTWMDAEHLLACGHPLLKFGAVELPMTKSTVLVTLPSPANAFKIATTTESIGEFVQDRHAGLLGRFGKEPRMIPVTLNFGGGEQHKSVHFEVLGNPRLTPMIMMAAVFNAIQGINAYGEDISFRVSGDIDVAGEAPVAVRNMYAPGSNMNPTAALIAAAIGERFTRLYDNPYDAPEIRGVNLNLDLIRERRWAQIESARTDQTEVRPGEEIMVEAVLRPYHGEQFVCQVPLRIPTSTPRGTMRILVSDGETLDHMHHASPAMTRRFGLNSTIALLNKEHSNSRLYVSLLEATPQAVVEDKVMPALPLSVMNVMDNMRLTQDMVVSAESAMSESSAGVDYVVSGARFITITVK